MATKTKANTQTEEVVVETITPEMAREYLSFNDRNRHIKARAVAKLVRDMQSGRFLFNGDPIRFFADNSLADGQHRLVACIESDIPFRSVVVRGIVQEAGSTIDQGVARSPGDAMKIAGFNSYVHQSAAIAKAVINYVTGSPRSTPTSNELIAVVRHIPDIVKVIAPSVGRLDTPGINRSLIGAVWAIGTIQKGRADAGPTILSGLSGNVNTMSDHPVLHAVREYAMMRERKGLPRTRNREFFAMHGICYTQLHEQNIVMERLPGSIIRPELPEDIRPEGVTLEMIGLREDFDVDYARDRMERLSHGGQR